MHDANARTHPEHCYVGGQLLPAKKAAVFWTAHNAALLKACCAEGVAAWQRQRLATAFVVCVEADATLQQILHAV
jgi:hypothetical protein